MEIKTEGTGESGKSTIFKQMKIIQLNGGFTKEDLNSFKYVVYGNCINQMNPVVWWLLIEKLTLAAALQNAYVACWIVLYSCL